MPTENCEVIPGKVFIKTNENDELKELGEIKAESIEICNDDAVDAMRYYAESVTNKGYSAELTFSKEEGRRFLKMMGLETITRKRFKKLLMGCGFQRNQAEKIAKIAHKNNMKYTPMLVQEVIETIIREVEKIKAGGET